MPKVRIVGKKGNGRYVSYEVTPQKATEVIKKLQEEPGMVMVKSRLLLPSMPKFANNTKI